MLKIITTLTNNLTNIVRLNGKLGWTGVAATKRNRDIVFDGKDIQFLALHIVDTEVVIEAGNWVISSDYDLRCVESPRDFRNFNWYKIIASTDTSFGLPIIPETYIQDLINHIDSPILKYEIHGGCFFPFIDYHYKEKNRPQVDFDLLKHFNDFVHVSLLEIAPAMHKEIANHKLFFQQLSESEEFAIQAHKKLSK